MADAIKSKTFTAPRCRIMHDGKVVGRATGITIRVDTEYTDIDVIDDIETIEFAPVGYKVSGSMSFVRPVGTTLKSIGMIPATGKTSAQHLLNILNHGLKSLVLLDKPTNKYIATITNTVFTSWDASLQARGTMAMNVQWRAKRELDESEAA